MINIFLELEQVIIELERRHKLEDSVRKRVLLEEALMNLKKVKELDEEDKDPE